MEEWKEYKLGEVLTIKYGKDHKQLKDGSFPVYGSGGIMRYANKYIYEGPSILIPRKGSLNNIMYSNNPFWTVDTMFWTIIKDDIVNPLYLYYSIYKKDFASLNVGSAVPSLTVPVIEDIDICLPPRNIQDKIASILKSLDDKIENNRKINENLEQQAQALFKSWFVDFEPFRDQPFVESELGMIPEGWRLGTLGEIATISKKSINPANEPDKLYSHYSLPAFDDNKYPQKQFGKEIKSNKFLFNENSILLSKLNPIIKRIWYIDKLEDNPICSTEFLPIETVNNAFIAFVYCCIKDELYYSKLLSGVTGATNSHQRLSPNDIVNLRIPINEKSIEDFNIIVLPMLTMINANIRENLHLSQLRDTLLPKLMSGELKI